MNPMYFENEDAEFCHEIEWFQSDMKDNDLTEIEVFTAIPDKSTHHFWCKAVDEVCLSEDNFLHRHLFKKTIRLGNT